jgi:transcriptional regulator with XRE-family HTH domain
LREARDARGWTQQDLSDALGAIGAPMDRTTIAKLEKRQREVRLDELVAIAAALDCAPVFLFLPIDGDAPVRLAPKLQVDGAHARAWARGEQPLRPENRRFYLFQAPDEPFPRHRVSSLAELRDYADELGVRVIHEPREER